MQEVQIKAPKHEFTLLCDDIRQEMGGKTSLMGRLAWEARQAGKKVLIATTTHMARPNQYAALTDDAQAIIRQLQQEGVVIAGLPAGEKKISFIGQAAYDRACAAADLVLVEADGSRRAG